VLIALAVAELLPFIAALSDGAAIAWAMVAAMLCNLALAGLLLSAFRHLPGRDDARTAFVMPVLVFVGGGLAASLPFAFSGVLRFDRAVFESISALTTTAASVMPETAELPRAILLWQGVLAWLGGMATVILVFWLIKPLRIGGLGLVRSTFPPGEGRGFLDRLRATAVRVLVLYASFAVLAMALMMIAGLAPFDAVRSGLSMVATAGYRPVLSGDLSVGAQIVFIAAMLLGAINASLLWPILSGRPWLLPMDAETRTLIAIVLAGAAALAILSEGSAPGAWVADMWRGLFLSVSLLTTTAITAPAEAFHLPVESALVAAILALVGGCAGSTAGGVKLLRARLLFAQAQRELARLAYPHRAMPSRYGATRVGPAELGGFWLALMAFLIAFSLGALGLAFDGAGPRTALALALAGLANAGGLAALIDPSFPGYQGLSATQQAIFAFLALVGRADAALVAGLIARSLWR